MALWGQSKSTRIAPQLGYSTSIPIGGGEVKPKHHSELIQLFS